MSKSSRKLKKKEQERLKIWVTNDKRQILIADMTDQHLDNAIAYAKRFPGWRTRQVPLLLAEQLRRAPMRSANRRVQATPTVFDWLEHERG